MIRRKIKITKNPKMTKSEVIEYFKENILPYVREKYESDRIIDTPARREAWNDMVDFLIKDGSVSKSAEDWGLPSQFERKERKNPTRVGTSYFKSISDAVRYYKPYNLDREDVMEKIRRGEIHVGKPPVRAEEHTILDPLENRYFYQTRNPKRKLTKSKSRRNPECCTKLTNTSLKEGARRLLGNEYTPDRERNLLSVYRKYKTIIERGTFNEDRVNDVISAFDKALLNYGVEHIRPGKLEDYEEKVITYSNTGDTYNPTILHVDGKFWIGSWGDVIENDYETYSSRNPKKSKKSRNPRNIQLKPAKRYSIDIPSRLSIILKRDPKLELGGEAIFVDGIFKGYIEKIDSEFVLTPASEYEGKDRTYHEGNKIGFVQGPSFYSYTKTALLERVQK